MTLSHTIRIHAAGRWLSAFAAASLVAISCPAQESVPIRFSKPFDPILSTNLNALVGAKQKTFQEVLAETDGRGASGFFRDDAPIGLLPTPPRPRMSPAAAQKFREEAERKKNWAFTIESDVERDPKISPLLKFLDADTQAENARQRSVYEKFYERLEREGKANDGSGSSDSLDATLGGPNSDDPLRMNDPAGFGALNMPGLNSGADALPGSSSLGDTRRLSDAKPRDVLSMGTRRDALSTATTRQATDFKEYERGSLAGGLTTPSQQARFDAFKSMFEVKPSAGIASAPASKPSSALSTALGNLGLPSSPGAGAAASASRGSFAERFDSTPGWKPSAPVSTPLPPVNSAFPSTPSRSGTLFPTIPTRRQ